MLSFKDFLLEKILSVGFNPSHEKHREKHRDEVYSILHKAYSKVPGGYGGLGSGSENEKNAIHDDISKNNMKLVKRDDKIVALGLYKNLHGRKTIAIGSDGSEQGFKDLIKLAGEDNKQKRSWVETSGKATAFMKKSGNPDIPTDIVKSKLLPDKKITKTGEYTYTRSIGGHEHEKQALGHYKGD